MAVDKAQRLRDRYERIGAQLDGLFAKNPDPISRMATAAALLQHKMTHFFWTGFYRFDGEDLRVGPYQGPLACSILEREQGVCWACLRRDEAIVVPDVNRFEGHIACDSRSRSEVVVPVRDADGRLRAVLDVDAKKEDAFSDVDARGLQAIADRIYQT